MSVTETAAWKALEDHAAMMQNTHLRDLFLADSSDKKRFDELSLSHEHLLLDFSKQRITQNTLTLLKALADNCQLNDWKARLFNGDHINTSEDRPALHTALRQPEDSHLALANHNIIGDVHANLAHMASMVERIHAGQWRGYSGLPIDTIVNIGVGGSDLGPLMACKALSDAQPPEGHQLKMHFVSSMDGSQIADLLDRLVPTTTLFIISSKSFTTIDTLSNANTARQWLKSASGVKTELLNRRHFIGISASAEKMNQWGIPENSQLNFWDWTGGRYSMWSAIGLPIALRIGMQGFKAMLSGAHAMDEHFKTAPFEENLPVRLGMIGIWNINFLNIHAHAILPYDGRLSHLPAYLEQLEMESNGKSVSRQGEAIGYSTCPILWGEIGPNAQHAFYQLLHQGSESVMCDFIAPARRYDDFNNKGLQQQHQLSLANCLAQSRLLALGDAAIAGNDTAPIHKRYRGNQPSTTVLLDELNPYSFGQLIALYEHKVFVQSVIWDINPFDQWGVELGKKMATDLLKPLENEPSYSSFDSSTEGLLNAILNKQEPGQ
ncbi:glucose-6-phosphate isomerase [Neptunomonas antarctica]|uniref:Glucose-6-phosphate isomerase n=1 Tax=Neptunomonas antarctica TaxID=619304 RepID=A0A1N7PF96_9GAMM|nr:glucose-6-phosphate isomerase [Neptunomonas antarctica]SIT09029.1 glucose-6-phosphate isomerase [Neptunomonas antarctica]